MTNEALREPSAADPELRRIFHECGAWHAHARDVAAAVSIARPSGGAPRRLNGTAASTILRRFKALFAGRRFPRPEDIATVSDETLRGAGFSRANVASIRDLAAKTLSGVVPTSRQVALLSDDEIIERLTEVRGAARWTVEMLLILQQPGR